MRKWLILLVAIMTTGVWAQEEDETLIHFAVIGDYGKAGESEAAVAEMVLSWEPDFIITTGDNNYNHGEASTIDQNIGQYYQSYIYPYYGEYGEGAEESNRFFPSLGNHDWETEGAQPYLDYFTLPGNERYYDFVEGPVHFFSIDSLANEPDGIDGDSVQAEWLREALADSTSAWQLVYMHVPPYSSGRHGSHPVMRWDYEAWGADAVLSGHDHTYERILIDGFPYFVNGVGGNGLYYFRDVWVEGSEVRYNTDFGAMLVEATADYITFEFYSIYEGGTRFDSYTIEAEESTENS
jgi:hypothetical protein